MRKMLVGIQLLLLLLSTVVIDSAIYSRDYLLKTTWDHNKCLKQLTAANKYCKEMTDRKSMYHCFRVNTNLLQKESQIEIENSTRHLKEKEYISKKIEWEWKQRVTKEANEGINNCDNKCITTMEEYYRCVINILKTTCNLRLLLLTPETKASRRPTPRTTSESDTEETETTDDSDESELSTTTIE